MLDYKRAYNNFKSLDKVEKLKKIKQLLESLKWKLTTYDDMYSYILDRSDIDIEDQSLINYYELILNDFIKMEEITSKGESKAKLKKLAVDMTLEKIEVKDQDYANSLLKNI